MKNIKGGVAALVTMIAMVGCAVESAPLEDGDDGEAAVSESELEAVVVDARQVKIHAGKCIPDNASKRDKYVIDKFLKTGCGIECNGQLASPPYSDRLVKPGVYECVCNCK